MRTRNYLPAGDAYCESLTVKQWQKKGCVPKEGADGEFMYYNGHRQDGAVYYLPCDVRAATEQEKAQWAAEQREQNRVRAAKSRERKREEKERLEMERARWEQEQREQEQREQERQAAARPFFDQITASGKKFAPVYVSDPLGESYGYYTYIVGRDVPAGTSVTAPFGEDNTPMSGTIGEGEYTFDDLKGEHWFPFGVKEVQNENQN